MTINVLDFVTEKWRTRLEWDSLPAAVQEQVARYGLEMYRLGQHVTGEIHEVKYDGRVVVLEDGSRWEVDSVDSGVAELWGPATLVVVIDGQMYNLEDAEQVAVQEEL